MNCKLLLYLKGAYYSSKEITLSDDSKDLGMKENFLIRESEMKSAVDIFRIEHYRQIIKCQYDYDIAAIFKSQMKKYGPEYDFI